MTNKVRDEVRSVMLDMRLTESLPNDHWTKDVLSSLIRPAAHGIAFLRVNGLLSNMEFDQVYREVWGSP